VTRILIGGGPRSGKTTLAKKFESNLGIRARHTDDLIDSHEWSEASAEVAKWLDEPGPLLIEGVAIARALRKWLAGHPHGRPVDVVYLASQPREELSKGQAVMAAGCATVWRQIRSEVVLRGVSVQAF